jgi:mono/diheme cytochrome c family protein
VGRRGQAALLAVAVAVLAAATALAWGRGGSDGAPRAGVTAALDGAALFVAKGCAVCHLAEGAEDGYGIGPDLRGLPETAGGRVPGMDAESYVRRSILEPGAFPPGADDDGFEAMPTLPVTPAELDALVAYLLADGG